MDERARRLWAGTEAGAIGYGGVAAVARATGIAISTVRKGRDEARGGARPEDVVNIRRSTGKRPYEAAHPEVWPALEKLVDPVTRGDPESPLRWTCKSTHALSAEMFTRYGIRVSDKTVAKLLKEHDYSLQAPNKSVEGKQHPDRNAQFEHINAKAEACIARGVPVISVDTKKKELVGNFKNGGREWQPQGEPELVDVHDFPSDAIGKAIPYGVYDLASNDGFVSVGVDHDTPTFAVTSIEAWWKRVGQPRYPDAREIFITADAGGSNGHRPRMWKAELQRLADKLDLAIHVSHFPPGTSKWNKIEHRLFSFISINWRGRPLRTYETIINLIGNTTNRGGLVVRARLDRRCYPIGKKISAKEFRALKIERDDFHGDWNYVVKPRKEMQ
ncbi:MAG: ISAzo13 family transposase [Myxococcota bacterium]|nr:ISAzo13 family transposase [Myxococcota bacterium]